MKNTILNFAKDLYNIWITERPNMLSAALAYFGMFSFAPVIYIALVVAGFFINQLPVANNIYQRLENTLGADMAEYIQNAVYGLANATTNTAGSSFWTSAIAFFALFLAASGLFFQLQYALNTVWRVPPPNKNETTTMLKQRLFSFVMVIGVGLLLVAITLVSIILTWLDTLIQVLADMPYLNTLSLLGFTTLFLALIYKILPDADVAWRDVWYASALTTVLMALGGNLLGFYLTSGKFGSAFEAAGAVAVILMSFYFLAQIFLFGAVFTRVYAYTFGSKIGEEI